ncbi:MAG TPA: hypothetical protein VFC46_08080 [Humisphaera sp.]|nr:hypothetical protein [Humisphaera sp.]
MTGSAEFLTKIVALLNRAGIPHMLAGSVACIAYSGPRNTYDVDIVIHPTLPQLDALLALLKPDEFYVSAQAAVEAFSTKTMFNVIDLETGWKADLVLLRPRPFSVEEFGRRIPATIWGVDLPIVTPEDSIISKMEWRKDSRSERQYEDALRIAQSVWDVLDIIYLRQWAAVLGISDDLEQLLRDAKQLRPQ